MQDTIPADDHSDEHENVLPFGLALLALDKALGLTVITKYLICRI